jgi:hypothetical protein
MKGLEMEEMIKKSPAYWITRGLIEDRRGSIVKTESDSGGDFEQPGRGLMSPAPRIEKNIKLMNRVGL